MRAGASAVPMTPKQALCSAETAQMRGTDRLGGVLGVGGGIVASGGGFGPGSAEPGSSDLGSPNQGRPTLITAWRPNFFTRKGRVWRGGASTAARPNPALMA